MASPRRKYRKLQIKPDALPRRRIGQRISEEADWRRRRTLARLRQQRPLRSSPAGRLRWLSKTLVGQPSSMRVGPSLPAVAIDPLVTQQKCTQLLTSRAHRPYRRQTGRIKSRIASCAASGTQTALSRPPRCRTARASASRLSFFCRSPLLRGIIEGATTRHSALNRVRVR